MESAIATSTEELENIRTEMCPDHVGLAMSIIARLREKFYTLTEHRMSSLLILSDFVIIEPGS